MKCSQYQLKDLKFAKGKAAKVDERLAKQGMIVVKSRGDGKPVDVEGDLLLRICDLKR